MSNKTIEVKIIITESFKIPQDEFGTEYGDPEYFYGETEEEVINNIKGYLTDDYGNSWDIWTFRNVFLNHHLTSEHSRTKHSCDIQLVTTEPEDENDK